MTIAELLLLSLLAGSEAEGPQYPLGPLRLSPMAEDADPFRLVDLAYSFTDADGTVSDLEARVRAGSRIFVGGEVRGDRHGVSFDTQRLELGTSEENGDYEVEGSVRAPWFLLDTRASRAGGEWTIAGDGSVQLSNDAELLFGHAYDLDPRVFTPGSVEEFHTSGVLPEAGPRDRELRGTSLGFLYQGGNTLETLMRNSSDVTRSSSGYWISSPSSA
jgi:hypothetical protein